MIITDSNFDEVIGSHHVVLVDFWAEWCSPCKRFSPILDEVASEYNVWIGKIDADENTFSADKYNVISLPTVIVFKDGKEVKRTKGAMPKHKFLEEISEWI
jgi:thioredoxin 1